MLDTDIKIYQAANMPEDDASLTGGAINLLGLLEFTDLAANDTLEALSDNAADTMNLTITGRDAGSAIAGETLAMNGLTVVSFTTTLSHFLKGLLAAAPAGTITIRRSGAGATVATILPGKTSARRMFYDATSEVGATTRFGKGFFKNEHGVDTLNSAAIELTADPSTSVRVGCAPSKDDSATVANRKATPASVTFVDDGVSQGVPGGTLAAAEAIGFWAEFSRGAGAAAVWSTFSLQLSGSSA